MVAPVTRVDLHVKVLNDQIVRRAKHRNIDVLVYAPHFLRLPEIQQQAEQFSDSDVTILPGRELFTGHWRNRRHILAIGLSEPVPDFISLDAAITECERQGASILIPHPTFMSVSLTADEIRAYRSRIEAVESYNPKFLPHHTRRARALAEELELSTFGSSYAHVRGTIGEVWTEIHRDIHSVADLQNAIEEEALGPIGWQTGVQHIGRRSIEFGHLFWENSWHKFDRCVRRGIEDTHPYHPAYEGRFDDDAVY